LLNAAGALAALELLEGRGIRVGEASVRKGLKTVRWEGRLEIIEPASPGAEVILDGAHNPAGAKVLRAFLEEARPSPAGRLILVLGILRDKDIDGILAQLVPLADEVVATRPRHPRAAAVADLKRHLEKYPVRVTIREPLEEALRYARSSATAQDRVCVTGSLFTVGEARSYLKGLAQPSGLRG